MLDISMGALSANDAKLLKATVVFEAPDENDEWKEGRFTVPVAASVSEEERKSALYRISPDMARLLGFPGYNVEIKRIELSI